MKINDLLLLETKGHKVHINVVDKWGGILNIQALISKNVNPSTSSAQPYKITWFNSKMEPKGHLAFDKKTLTSILQRKDLTPKIKNAIISFLNQDDFVKQGSTHVYKLSKISVTFDEPPSIVKENVEKYGYSPDEKHSDMPIDWEATDLPILAKWDKNTVKQFARLRNRHSRIGSNFVAIYKSILEVNDLHPRCTPIQYDVGEYDWDEYRRVKKGYPPIVVMREENGMVHILDGNHRVKFAQDSGYQTIGAWVVDKLIQKDIERKNRRKRRKLEETKIITPEESLYEGYITLYHGTTWPIALKAKKGELGPQNLKELVTQVLINVFHETPEESSKIYDKHVGYRKNDPQVLFLTTDKERAEGYARGATKYGGEIFMDILGSYFANHPEHRKNLINMTVEHININEPAIVTLNVPLEMVLTHPHWSTPIRKRIRDVLKTLHKHPNLKSSYISPYSTAFGMESFVTENIPARFVQRIDKIQTEE